jgi:hypothetical protein
VISYFQAMFHFLLPVLFMGAPVKDSIPPPKVYAVRRTQHPPVLDGRIGRREWRRSLWTDDFVDITGDPSQTPRLRTRCRMLWDDSCLYVAVEMEEPHLWATLTRHDAIIFQDNDFEVFLDPGGDAEQYFEYEVNALNTVMDLFMNRPYRKGGTYDMTWDAGLRTAVRLRGSLNDPSDLDRGWILEMAIPYSSLRRPGRPHLPSIGDRWRLDFSRVEWTLDPATGGYTRRKGPNGKPLPEDNWVWSPIGVVNMHIPERWGILWFKE